MKLTRRRFILGTAIAGGGLLVGYAATRPERHIVTNRLHGQDGQHFVTSWIRIDQDNQVTVLVPHSDMGQGVLTSLAVMAADELDADWSRVTVEQAPATDLFANGVLIKGFAASMGFEAPAFLERLVDFSSVKVAEILNLQITGGSSSVRFTGELGMRTAGAGARQMLTEAAAAHWQVPVSELRTENSYVHHPASGRQLSYGELAASAAALSPPRNPVLKVPGEFTLMGRSVPRRDIPAKVQATAKYGIDAQPSGMLYAAVRTAPVFGSKLVRVDNIEAAQSRRGVIRIIELGDAVAVVADNYWRAAEALKVLEPEFTETEHDGQTSDSIFALQDQALASGRRRRDVITGDAESALRDAPRIITAAYRVPYLAHAAMEPMNCIVHFHNGGCEVWSGAQDNLGLRGRVARVAGLSEDSVIIHPVYLGGGFGRRLPGTYNLVDQATRIASHFDVPVQTLWDREEDIRQDYYRPAVSSRFRAGLDAGGRVIAWENVYTGKNEPAEAAHLAYEIANQQIEYVDVETHIPFGAWRSVAHSQHSFFLESFVDELAWAAGEDPLQFRLAMLEGKPRHQRVLNEAAARAGWATPTRPGRARGIALQESFGSIVAEVAEISLTDAGEVRVENVVCAVDCGRVIHPDAAASQIEGGILYGLTAALYGQITIQDGKVLEGNFHDYPMLRLADSPSIEVILLESDAPVGGLGEPSTPPIAAAVTNALYALTGQRIRELPLRHYRFTPVPTEAGAT